MDYNFESYLLNKLLRANVELKTNLKIYVSEEQNFAKMDKLEPDAIYVVVKYLSSSIQYYTETTPIQILVLSEQNSLDKARMLMNKYATENNWVIDEDGTTYVKHQYNSPVVLNNYVEVGYGYRSVLYVTGTLFILENIIDVSEVKIDNEAIEPLSFNMSYSMSTNTQQLPNEEIASSQKTVSTFAITMTIPMIGSTLATNIMKIIDQQETGNKEFTISFKCGLAEPITKAMKLISAQITTAPNQIPGLQIGFMR